MSKSLAELRQSPDTSLPERTYRLCLAQGLVAQAEALENEKADLQVAADRLDPDAPAAPKRAADGPDPRIAEIDDELGKLYDKMDEHTGVLLLRGVDGGTWGRFTDANPPREDNKRDDSITYGFCNADALLADLGKYVVSHNGAPLEAGDWDFIESKAAPGDLKEMCRYVVQMHEVTGIIPKSRNASSSSRSDESD